MIDKRIKEFIMPTPQKGTYEKTESIKNEKRKKIKDR